MTNHVQEGPAMKATTHFETRGPAVALAAPAISGHDHPQV
jgi:hypothetical protein